MKGNNKTKRSQFSYTQKLPQRAQEEEDIWLIAISR